MKTVKKIMQKENGVTLVELLAAIAILSIIVTAFLAFFIQAANTNNRTDDKNEATFLAVEEMEKITSYSIGDYDGDEVNKKHFNEEKVNTFITDNGMTVTSTLEYPSEDSPLYKVEVKVTKGEVEFAHMESSLPFEKISISED